MGFSIYSNSDKINYGIKHIIADTFEDLKKLSVYYAPGTTVFITESSECYILNTKKQWIQMASSSGGGGSTPTPTPTPEPEYDTLVYDGGSPV